MQLLRCLFVLCTVACQCLAFKAQDAHLSFMKSKQRGIMLGNIDNKSEKYERPIVIDHEAEILELGFMVPGPEQPSQVTLLLGLPDRDLEIPLRATLVENQGLSLYRIQVAASKIPQALSHYSRELKKPLTASLILASEGAENVFAPIFDLQLELEKDIQYSEPSRYGAQPEIHHVFNPEPKSAPCLISQLFSSAIVALVFVLLISWSSSGALSFKSVPSGLNFLYFVAFIGSIVGFEYIFAMYYSGSSIFETLHSAFYLGIPSLWVGTKFLRYFSEKL